MKNKEMTVAQVEAMFEAMDTARYMREELEARRAEMNQPKHERCQSCGYIEILHQDNLCYECWHNLYYW